MQKLTLNGFDVSEENLNIKKVVSENTDNGDVRNNLENCYTINFKIKTNIILQ